MVNICLEQFCRQGTRLVEDCWAPWSWPRAGHVFELFSAFRLAFSLQLYIYIHIYIYIYYVYIYIYTYIYIYMGRIYFFLRRVGRTKNKVCPARQATAASPSIARCHSDSWMPYPKILVNYNDLTRPHSNRPNHLISGW